MIDDEDYYDWSQAEIRSLEARAQAAETALAETEALVLSHEGHIEKLEAKVARYRAALEEIAGSEPGEGRFPRRNYWMDVAAAALSESPATPGPDRSR